MRRRFSAIPTAWLAEAPGSIRNRGSGLVRRGSSFAMRANPRGVRGLPQISVRRAGTVHGNADELAQFDRAGGRGRADWSGGKLHSRSALRTIRVQRSIPMRRIAAFVLVALFLASIADAQQKGQRRAPAGRKGVAARSSGGPPQSGSATGSSQNSSKGLSSLQVPGRRNYRAPAAPLPAPKPREVKAEPMMARTHGGANPYAGKDMRPNYARGSYIGGRRLRSANSETVKRQVNRRLTQFSNNATINNRFARGPKGRR